VELTHIFVSAIAKAVKQAKELGASLVVVHGGTIIEQVEKGTNWVAAQCSYVDILAHPGLLSLQEAGLAAEKDIVSRMFLSLSILQETLAKPLIDSDAHKDGDLVTLQLAGNIA
jgi:putative hydrolase